MTIVKIPPERLVAQQAREAQQEINHETDGRRVQSTIFDRRGGKNSPLRAGSFVSQIDPSARSSGARGIHNFVFTWPVAFDVGGRVHVVQSAVNAQEHIEISK